MRSQVIFWDVDTQVDFMHPGGKLYVPEAESLVPNLRALTAFAHAAGIRIVASADDHVRGHRELSAQPDFRETFPEHCMRDTPGQAKIPETRLREPLVIEPDAEDPGMLADRVRAHPGDILFHKHWFDVFTNPNVLPVLAVLDPAHIVLYGVAQDVCDRYAIEGLLAHRPTARLHVVRDAMKPIDREAGERLLRQWSDQGVHIVATRDVVSGGLLAGLGAAVNRKGIGAA
jgi:nicotinamidase/pyrazinamidase